MCRRKHLRNSLLLGIGLGLVAGQCLDSWLVCSCGGSALVLVGFFGLMKK